VLAQKPWIYSHCKYLITRFQNPSVVVPTNR